MANERMTAAERTAQLVEVGYNIARKHGIRKVTRAAVARDVQISAALVNRYLDGREGLRFAVMQHAADKRDAKTLAAAGEFYELDSIAMPKVMQAEVKRLMKQ